MLLGCENLIALDVRIVLAVVTLVLALVQLYCLRSGVVENLSQALLGPRRRLESEIVMCLVLCMTAIFH